MRSFPTEKEALYFLTTHDIKPSEDKENALVIPRDFYCTQNEIAALWVMIDKYNWDVEQEKDGH